MSVQTFSPESAIKLTSAALGEVQKLTSESHGGGQPRLRVYVSGGGCSGFSYGFKLDTDMGEDDTCVQQDGVYIVVDSLSFQYLVGAEVDYRENLQGKQFFVSNPNATSTCGCGNSFSI